MTYSRTRGTVGTGAVFLREVAHLKAEKIALGYIHNLSKRTALYATVAYREESRRHGLHHRRRAGVRR